MVVDWLQIDLTKELGTLKLIKKIINLGDQVSVLNSDFVQGSIINIKSPCAILLLHRHNWAPTGQATRLNVSLLDELMNLTFYFLILQKGASTYWTIGKGSNKYQVNGMFDLTIQRHPYRWGKDVSIFLQNLIHLLFLCREFPCSSCGAHGGLLFTFWTNQEENKLCSLRD